MFTASQVSLMLGVSLPSLNECLVACRGLLSPSTRRKRGPLFSDDDVAVIARACGCSRDGRGVVVECAWCGKHLGFRQGFGTSGISHGMCPECSRKFMSEYEATTADAAG